MANNYFHRSKNFRNHRQYDKSVPRIFNQGARHYLHPKLAVLDSIDCILEYHAEPKTMVVMYDPTNEKVNYTDYKNKIYRKTVISQDVEFILDVINKDYIHPLREDIRHILSEDLTTL